MTTFLFQISSLDGGFNRFFHIRAFLFIGFASGDKDNVKPLLLDRFHQTDAFLHQSSRPVSSHSIPYFSTGQESRSVVG